MFRALLLLLLAQDALSLQIAVRPLAPATLSRSPAVHAQFGGGEKPKGLSRDSEPEEFFKTNMGARTATARGHFARAPSHLAQCSRRRDVGRGEAEVSSGLDRSLHSRAPLHRGGDRA